MLYVLVNNNYQLRALMRHFAGRTEMLAHATLIAVPHTLKIEAEREKFDRVVVLTSPQGTLGLPWLLGSYFLAGRKAAKQFAPDNNDVLIFFTEVEWLNQIVVQIFKFSGAKTVLLEDGGFGTYVPMGQPESDPLTLRERCIQASFRLLPALRYSKLFKVNRVLFPRLPDSSIDAIALYRDAPIYRNIVVHRVAKPTKTPCTICQGSVIFLNEPLYDYYQSREDYLNGLKKLFDGLTSGFDKVYFKFHPRESFAWRADISALISEHHPNIEIIKNNLSIEEIINTYLPEVLASYFSAALIGIEYEGIEPMYLYHLVDDLANHPTFTSVTQILRSWGYNFVDSVDQIRAGYRSHLCCNSASAEDFFQFLNKPTLHV